MISPQASKPIFCIVQDSLLGAYKMTYGIQTVTKAQFFSLSMVTQLSSQEVLDRMQHIRRIFKLKNKKVQCFHGKGLISLLLPMDFEYEKTNKVHPDEPTVRIHRGVLYEGTLDKSCLGATTNSILHRLYKEYSADVACKFIDEIQFITNQWLLEAGFSIGLGDCIVKEEKRESIQDVVKKCYIEAEGIKTTTSHPGIKEARIMGALSKARDVGMKIAKEGLDPDNNLKKTVESGSKGDYFNIAQITGLLGQQNFNNKRANLSMSNGKRTLPHFPFEDMPVELDYESRGFVSSSFGKGLSPREFYFHMMTGRDGTMSTSLSTATSGYMMRRIVKLTEDMKTQYDSTVRDTSGAIFQPIYGETGYDPKNTIKVDGDQQVCDIYNLADKLNLDFERKHKK